MNIVSHKCHNRICELLMSPRSTRKATKYILRAHACTDAKIVAHKQRLAHTHSTPLAHTHHTPRNTYSTRIRITEWRTIEPMLWHHKGQGWQWWTVKKHRTRENETKTIQNIERGRAREKAISREEDNGISNKYYKWNVIRRAIDMTPAQCPLCMNVYLCVLELVDVRDDVVCVCVCGVRARASECVRMCVCAVRVDWRWRHSGEAALAPIFLMSPLTVLYIPCIIISFSFFLCVLPPLPLLPSVEQLCTETVRATRALAMARIAYSIAYYECMTVAKVSIECSME